MAGEPFLLVGTHEVLRGGSDFPLACIVDEQLTFRGPADLDVTVYAGSVTEDSPSVTPTAAGFSIVRLASAAEQRSVDVTLVAFPAAALANKELLAAAGGNVGRARQILRAIVASRGVSAASLAAAIAHEASGVNGLLVGRANASLNLSTYGGGRS